MLLRLCGLALSLASAACYGVAVVVQAAEARAVPRSSGARAGLLLRLAARPKWWLGTAIGVVGWPLQTAALTIAPIGLVQPALAAAPVIVLVLAVRMLGERAGVREMLGVAGIAAGVVVVTVLGPRGHAAASVTDAGIVVAALCAFALLPTAVRFGERAGGLQVVVGAGLAFAASGIASKVTADGLAANAAGVIAIGIGLAALTALVGVSAEMSAYQRITASVVAPITFALEIGVPVALAPWLTESGRGASELAATVAGLMLVVAGVVLLASGPAVSHVTGAAGARGA
jgi:drug/metabolite transporter (DMT)-like permease